MDNLILKEKEALEKFQKDTRTLGVCTDQFVGKFYPSYGIVPEMANALEREDSYSKLNSFTFYKICECSICGVEDRLEYFSSKMQKLFSAAYSIHQEVCYGIVSNEGKTSLVLGVAPATDDRVIKTIIEGQLPGIQLEHYTDGFVNAKMADGSTEKKRYLGCISGVPALKIDGKLQSRDLSALMRSLNGQNYTIMVLCKPLDVQSIQDKINQAVSIQDQCYSISKRTIAYMEGSSDGKSHTEQNGTSDVTGTSRSSGMQFSAALPGMAAGAMAGATLGTPIPVIGNIVGAIGGGLVGLIAGKQIGLNRGKTKSKSHAVTSSYSDAVSEAINKSGTISGEVQNGYAIELMKMAQTMTDRLKVGRSIGMWESVVTYSSDSSLVRDVIQGGLYGEIASGIPDILPPVIFSAESEQSAQHYQQAMIPKGFFDNSVPCESPLCSLVTSEELCGICTIPAENTVGFEINETKDYSLNYHFGRDDKVIGHVCDHERPILNMPFGLSEYDLNKHTFVCGITGSGKTNSVKRILESVDKPFLVIEPAKKEYRNIQKMPKVYTLGRPEINCLKLNPFYILPGVSPQQHIDRLKDLFSASFAFYGPMPYILEKCLNNIYKKCGWNLTLGYHPKLIGEKGAQDLFDEEAMQKKYSLAAHRYVFPTMQDLKKEVDRYIEEEMSYEGEVKGNIRGAIKARIDSLCEGSKGYMFNTCEMVDMERLLSENTVLELEGLADDADKAFALGLLIIYINEYRSIDTEMDDTQGLRHLLVIEEAHRLLKNVSTENNEDLGNPKGKAVEHFTNMLAEMRSYGQGVIVAEQIPSKLAPDVIKNSSNKIIHRLVAKDDKEQIASTIGVLPEDAIHLGMYKVGYALCHKEGMVQPVVVKIDAVGSQCVKDVALYQQDLESKMLQISQSMLQSSIPEEINSWAFRILVSLMCCPEQYKMADGMEAVYEAVQREAAKHSVAIIPGVDKRECIRKCLEESILKWMTTEIFQSKSLPENGLVEQLEKTLRMPAKEELAKLSGLLVSFYKRKPEGKAAELIAGLVAGNDVAFTDVRARARDLCLVTPTETFYSDVAKYL